jgi:FkbM family methyltransferase
MVEIIESRDVKIPFYPEIVTPSIERPLRRGKYEGGECLAVENVVGKGDRVLELGTGLGLVSTKAALADGVERVLTFEANPALIPVIRETHQLNGVTGRIEVINGVVTRGEAPETLTFYRRRDFWGSSLSPVPDGWVDQVDVVTHDFDQVLIDLKPTVIVCDIEGGELDLFAGADLTGVKYVIMEIHPRVYGAAGVKQIFDAMSAKGFGYSPKISRGGTVITFERVGRQRITQVSNFAAPAIKAASKRVAQEATIAEAPKVFVPTCMKNEGPFILEWIAYCRVMGISDFLIFSNDCEDGTDRILQRLDDLGFLTHLPNPAPVFDSPNFQPAALKYAIMTEQYRRSDFVISMDVDEFLNIRTGDGTIPALLNAVGDFDVICLNESLFGSNGQEHFSSGFVTTQYTKCSSYRPGNVKARRGVKSILRRDCGLVLKNHRPYPNAEHGFDGTIWKDGSGNRPPENFIHDLENGMDCRGRFDLAYLNHYPLRSMESFLLKRDRGDVVARNRKVSVRYWRVRNRHDETDEGVLRHLPAAQAEYDRLIADPVLNDLHHASIVWHKNRITELRKKPDFVEFLDEIKAIS